MDDKVIFKLQIRLQHTKDKMYVLFGQTYPKPRVYKTWGLNLSLIPALVSYVFEYSFNRAKRSYNLK